MKANEAPEKLYLLPNGLISYRRNTDEDVEYCCADAFIEKACEWLEDNMMKWFKNMNTHGYKMTGLMIEDFKKAMKL